MTQIEIANRLIQIEKQLGYVKLGLRESGDRYIYDAMKRGYTADWREQVPADIACGLDTTAPGLLDRRKLWNRPAPEPFALPTEIWRETIARWQRCDQLMAKIASGEITHINDFITLNLDIRSFAYNILAGTADRKLVANFYHALQSVTILDPTCGSGAFLFAALGILEPLYEVCILRMQEWNGQNPNWFKDELGEIHRKYRSNIQYFIYKSIILRNLYGVDIMVEATEIAKLRLFLKMVAVVEVDRRADNMGLDPLPDVDFNIRCGNTLVGYATEKQIEGDLAGGDLFAAKEFRDKIEERMRVVSSAYKLFRHVQLVGEDDREEYVMAKNDLRQELLQLNDLLSRHLFKVRGGDDYEAYLASHQPFHWVAEFYHIIHGKGGFDVVIGNPPYVSVSKISYIDSTEAFACKDLYGFVIKRVFDIINDNSRQGFIVMHNLAFSRNFKSVRKLLCNQKQTVWFSFYSRIPSGLFDGNVRVRNAIYLTSKGGKKYSTRLHRWFAEQRNTLFQMLKYSVTVVNDVIPMLDSAKLQAVYEYKKGQHLLSGNIPLYLKKTAYNCLPITPIAAPTYDANNHEIESDYNVRNVSEEYAHYINLLLCGKFIFTRWLTYGDDFHLTLSDLVSIRFPWTELTIKDKETLDFLYKKFNERLKGTLQFKLNSGKNVGTYNVRALWDITDESDVIFLKYITRNPEICFESIQNLIASSVISDKK